MKVSVIAVSNSEATRERSNDIFKIKRNPDPLLHPFEKAREANRALNATKLDRVFAKPFLGNLDGHRDGVYVMAKQASNLSSLLSGSADGEVRFWNLATKETVWKASAAHRSFVRGLSFFPKSTSFVSASDDKSIKIWSSTSQTPLSVHLGESSFRGVDVCPSGNTFASCSSVVSLWDANSLARPLQDFTSGSDTITTVKFNPVESNILASLSFDRSIVLYDTRSSTIIAKTTLTLRSNAISWNPMEPFIFTVANEDYNCYSFDMRKMDSALNVLKDHVSAVIDLDYSPTGQEIVTGGYDRSLRIFNARSGHSRDIYHTKRMQRLFCVKYSMDSKYVISGSDDGNIRLWKAEASQKIAIKAPRERSAQEYNAALKERYKQLPEIRRISKHRHIPKAIVSAAKNSRIIIDSKKRRETNERKHSKITTLPIAERKKPVLSIHK